MYRSLPPSLPQYYRTHQWVSLLSCHLYLTVNVSISPPSLSVLQNTPVDLSIVLSLVSHCKCIDLFPPLPQYFRTHQWISLLSCHLYLTVNVLISPPPPLSQYYRTHQWVSLLSCHLYLTVNVSISPSSLSVLQNTPESLSIVLLLVSHCKCIDLPPPHLSLSTTEHTSGSLYCLVTCISL